jgi:hypothetical protein
VVLPDLVLPAVDRTAIMRAIAGASNARSR